MYEVSEKFIEYCKRHQRTYKNCTITYEDNGETKTINGDKIIKVEISATPYIDYQLIGQAPSKKIHINLQGKNYDLTNKEIQVSTTMYYDDNTSETLGLGTYIISNDYESQVKDECSFTGYDYMIKLDTQYSDEGLEYPCTLQDVLNNLCEQNDLELYSININNGKLQVTGNNFDDTFTYRDVLRQIAQASGTFAYIDRQNKVHVDNLNKVGSTGGTILQFKLQGTLQIGGETTDNYKDEITPSYYMQNFQSSRLYGPVNKVQITLTDVEDATYKEDTASIRNNGIQTITINDNFFLGTIEAREYAIKNLWTALYGLRYVPFSAEYLGFPYLEMGDLIQVEELDGTTTESYVFNYVFTYDGGYMGSLETPTITRTQETYPTNSIEEKLGKFGFSVDRANKEISAVAEDVTGVKAELTLKIDKDDNDQIISMINASADVIELNSNRLVINSTYFQLDEDGNITATSGDIGGFTIGTDTLSCDISTTIGPFTSADQERVQQIIMGEITPTSEDIEKYDIDGDGEIDILDYSRIGRAVLNGGYFTYEGTFTLDTNNYFNTIKLEGNGSLRTIGLGSVSLGQIYMRSYYVYNSDEPSYSTYCSPTGIILGDSTNYNQASLSADDSGADLTISLSTENWCSIRADGEYSALTLSGATPQIYMQGTSPEIILNESGTTASFVLDNGYIYANKLKLGYTKAYYNSTEYTGTTFNTANDLYIATTNSSGSSVTGYLHCRIVNGIICSV